MKKHHRHLLSALLLIFVLLATACTGNTGSTSTTAPAASTTAPAGTVNPGPTTGGEDPAAADFTYPMDPVTISINHPGWADKVIPDWAAEYWWVDKMTELTGVTLKPMYSEASGSGSGNSEAFFLMLASGDLPDILQNNWLAYPGGPEAAITQNLIIPLNDVFEQHSPNMMKLITEDPDVGKYIRTDSGTYYVYPMLRNPIDQNFFGIGYRQDKLDELNLKVPTTPDELETVLTAFKEAGMQTGMSFEYRFLFLGDQGYGTALQSGFGIKSGFWVEDGVVHYGEAEPAYEDFLKWMNHMYTSGLFDPDMPSVNKATSLAKFTSGDTWASINMDAKATATLADLDPSFTGVAGPSLSTAAGTTPKFGHLQNRYPGLASMAISAKCTQVETVARYLDWCMSDDGAQFLQLGVEGFAYAIVDGKVSLDINDMIVIDNEEAKDLANRRSYYAVNSNWPMNKQDKWQGVLDDRMYPVYDTWRANDMEKHMMPPVTLTEAESKEYSSLVVDIDTYIKEQVAMFIIGTKPMSDYQNFRDTLTTLGIDRIIQLQQAAYDRYLTR